MPHPELLPFLSSLAASGADFDLPGRFGDISSRLERQGVYVQTAEELAWLAKLAWRNNARCIGRLPWNTLQVLDARAAATADEVFDACLVHLETSTNGGAIRPVATVFAAVAPGEQGIRIHNRQLIRYAGYRLASGSVLGDPEQEAFTRRAIQCGWRPPREPGPFDVLPLLIQPPHGDPQWYELPRRYVLEVPISHPELAWFADLRLKWHALPALSDMGLAGAGLYYPACIFSGHYMGTEIASRNFGDEGRYHLLPVIAERLGLDRSARHGLWKDRALVELNTAVLYSFRQAGVTIVDHHTASRQFLQHVEREERCGREVPGDWSWLVPPLSGSASPVFHRYYSDERPTPAFVDAASPPTGTPPAACPFHGA